MGRVPEGERLVRRQRGARGCRDGCRTLQQLRLRAAYGASGQQPALNTALQTLSPVAGPNGQGVLTPNTLGNQDLKPERVEGLELGFETSMFNDRFGIDFTYFHDKSKDAILSRGVAPSTGSARHNQFFNSGQITKQGIELALKGQIVNTARLRVGRELHARHPLVEDRPPERPRYHDRPRSRRRTASGTRRSTGSRTRC